MFNDVLTYAEADPVRREKQGQETGKDELLVMVLGMHRSGTSLVTHILKEAGFHLGDPSDLIDGNDWNPKGYFERWSVMSANDQILRLAGGSWYLPPELSDILRIDPGKYPEQLMAPYRGHTRSVIKDPRLCLTLPLWKKALGKGLRIIRVMRNPKAVAASLERRDGFSLERGLYLWKVYNDAADRFSAGMPVFTLSYEEMFSERRPELLSGLSRFLETDSDLEEIALEIIDPNLQHHSSKAYRPGDPLPLDLTSVSLYERANQLLFSGRQNDALNQMERLVATYPKHILGCNDLGVLYHSAGRLEEALFCFRRAISLAPDNDVIRENMNALVDQMGDLDIPEKATPLVVEKDTADSRPWWDYPRFATSQLRVLLFGSRHLLLTEISGALERMGHKYQCLMLESDVLDIGQVKRALKETISSAQPDFLLTVNHSGLDNEGVVTELLESYRLPVASWCVDSPYLIFQHYESYRSPYLSLFLWDSDYIDVVRDLGLEYVDYLPLGVDERVFRPIKGSGNFRGIPDNAVGFVGNSMVIKSWLKLERSGISGGLLKQYPEVCSAFATSQYLTVSELLRHRFPDLYPSFMELSEKSAVHYETSVTWNATGQYRLALLRRLAPFSPFVAGDPGWHRILGQSFHLQKELNYYTGLPSFYNAVTVNFNATSRQMKRGVNQRVFDIPACRSVVVTDRTPQLEPLMEPGEEILTYDTPEELPSVVDRATHDGDLIKRVAEAGYRRVCSSHTYIHRVQQLIDLMRSRYA